MDAKPFKNLFHGDLTRKLLVLFPMYISQKIFLTFTWTLLPLILRRNNFCLGTIGFTALVYSPWALKFVHAPLVDRFYSPKFGKRKSWIIPLLCLSLVLLPLLAALEPTHHLGPLLGLIFILNILFATVDIAVDGYATDILTPEERPWGNTLQMIAYLLGYMAGAGCFLVVYENLGWSKTVLLITWVQLGLTLPVVFHREMAPVASEALESAKQLPSIGAVLTRPGIPWFLLLLMIIALCDQSGNHLRGPLFIDLGVLPRQLGQINIWIATPISIMGTLLGGVALTRLGPGPSFAMACAGAAGVSILSAVISAQWISLGSLPGLWPVQLLMGLDKFVMGTLLVITASMTMTMSAGGNQAATTHAVLSSAGHLAGFAVMPLAGMACDWMGYSNLFSGMALLALFSIFMGRHIIEHRLEYP